VAVVRGSLGGRDDVGSRRLFAVLSIGGFLGMGSHLVAVPYDSLKLVDKILMLPGGTKESLKMLPEFKYGSE
jgi:hypothetical protein